MLPDVRVNKLAIFRVVTRFRQTGSAQVNNKSGPSSVLTAQNTEDIRMRPKPSPNLSAALLR